MYDNVESDCEEQLRNGIDCIAQLRHCVNVLGESAVKNSLKVSSKRIQEIYELPCSGRYSLDGLLENYITFEKTVEDILDNEFERDRAIEFAKVKNENLINSLKEYRKTLCGLGTNKVKRRLNKYKESDYVALFLRVALEVEDKNILAKDAYGDYRDRIYKVKHDLICDLYKNSITNKINCGIEATTNYSTNCVIYFEIPITNEQISWHIDLENPKEFQSYNGVWDQQENTTIEKLERVISIYLGAKNEL